MGTGAVVSDSLILTCWHVVRDAPKVQVRANDGQELTCAVIDQDADLDVALLAPSPESDRRKLLADAELIPRALWRGAPLDNGALVELCTSDADTPRSLAVELRPGSHGARRVEFVVRGPREGVQYGASGGPVIEAPSSHAAPRMLGLVRARDETTVDALDQAGTGWLVPTERIAERFEAVAELVESPIERDPAWPVHWEPRSRGVATHLDEGYFFFGREAALASVRRHLEGGRGLLLVTGSRGRGKSALLARAVALSSRRHRASLQAAVAAAAEIEPAYQVDAAVHARDKPIAAVASALGKQLGLGDRSAGELVAALASPELSGTRLVVDALDESSDPSGLIRELIVPLAEVGACVVIAALARYVEPYVPLDTLKVDLDAPEFADDAVTPYVTRRLCVQGQYDAHRAAVVAGAVAARAEGNFLIAELVTRTLVAKPPINTGRADWQTELPADVTDAFRHYLVRFGKERERVLAVLQPLAYARGDGLTLAPPDAWLATANALRPDALEPVTESDLREASRRASDYLITGADGGARRLYHEGLATAIRITVARERLAGRGQAVTAEDLAAEQRAASSRFTEALVALLPNDIDAPAAALDQLDPYLLRYLPEHLAQEGHAIALLRRPGMLVASNREALRSALVTDWQNMPAEAEPASVAVVEALASPQPDRAERAAALCAALRRQGERELAERVSRSLGPATADPTSSAAGSRPLLPYELISAPPLRPALSGIPHAHEGAILAVAALEHEGTPLLLSGGRDGAVRSWRLDGRPGPLEQVHPGLAEVVALATCRDDSGITVFAASEDGAISASRLDSGSGARQLAKAQPPGIRAMTASSADGAPLVITAGRDAALRSFRADGTAGPLWVDDPRAGGIRALSVIEHSGRPLAITLGNDGALRSWELDGSPGTLEVPKAHNGGGRAMAVVEHEGAPLVLSAGWDAAVRSWRLDGSPGPLAKQNAHLGQIRALAALVHEGAPLVVTGGDDAAVRSWRLDGSPGPLTQQEAHDGAIFALGTTVHAGRPLVATAGEDGALRCWRLEAASTGDSPSLADKGWIMSLEVVERDARPLVISTGFEPAVRSWRLDGTAGPLYLPKAHASWIFAVATARREADPLVVTASVDGGLRSWGVDGTPGGLDVHDAHRGAILGVTAIECGKRVLIVSAGDDGALRSWWDDGSTGPLERPGAHTAWIRTVVALADGGGPLIVSGGDDGALRSWRLDGTPGPLAVEDAHAGPVRIATVARGNVVITGGDDGAVRSWHPDGSAGPFTELGARRGPIWSLDCVEHRGRTLVLSGGWDGAVRSRWLDGTPGPLQRPGAHANSIRAIAGLHHEGRTIAISGGDDRTILLHHIP